MNEAVLGERLSTRQRFMIVLLCYWYILVNQMFTRRVGLVLKILEGDNEIKKIQGAKLQLNLIEIENQNTIQKN